MSRPRCARRARAIAQTYSGAANQATEAWVAPAYFRQRFLLNESVRYETLSGARPCGQKLGKSFRVDRPNLKKKPRISRAFSVAGSGFEPATSGLCDRWWNHK